jgi:hypothetical protein
MRAPIGTASLFILAISMASPACAAQLVIPTDNHAFYSAYVSQPIDQPWAPQRPEPQLVERPVADLIATKLGVAEGSAQLFRFRLENAPSNATVLKGQIDGAGIRLKLTW